jgi:hypothetical protein
VLALLAATSRFASAQIPPTSLPVTFSGPINVSETPTLSQDASITLDTTGSLYACWEEYGDLILCARSDDAGETFSEPDRVAPGGPGLSFGQARIAGSDPGRLHVAFTSFDTIGGGAEIIYAGSTDGAETFPRISVVSEIDVFNSYAPDIGVGWGVVVAWNDTDLFTGGGRIQVSVSTDDGVTFSLPVRPDNSEGDVNGVGVAVAGDATIYTAWVQNDDAIGTLEASEIMFSRSTDSGATFSEPVNISNDDEKSWPAHVVADGDDVVHVLWSSGPAFDNRKLLLSTSHDAGLSFSEPRPVASAPESLIGDLFVPERGVLWLAWMSWEPSRPPEFQFTSHITRSIDFGQSFAAPNVLPGGYRIVSPNAAEVFSVWNEEPPGQTVSDVFASRGILELCGDADGDGHVSAVDALIALKSATGAAQCLLCRCDTDNSGQVTATDALALLQSAVGLAVSLDCERC